MPTMAKSPLHSCSLLLTISCPPTATDCKLHKQTAGPPRMHCNIHHPPQDPACSLQLVTAVTACGNKEAPGGAALYGASLFSGSCERPAPSCGQQANPQQSAINKPLVCWQTHASTAIPHVNHPYLFVSVNRIVVDSIVGQTLGPPRPAIRGSASSSMQLNHLVAMCHYPVMCSAVCWQHQHSCVMASFLVSGMQGHPDRLPAVPGAVRLFMVPMV
jgi:hypothetical protein